MNKQSEIAIDILSQLPQPIWHSILSLLPQKDAVRTCVLSKSWRYLWHGRLSVEFRDGDTCHMKTEFLSFLDKTLQRYLDQNLSLHKFLVDYYEVDFVLLKKWIPIVIMNMGVRSFNLIFSYSTKAYPLPLVVFQSESLVELHLRLCDLSTLKSTDNVLLKNLQTLRLHEVDITDDILEKIISSCPMIDNLDLLLCRGLKSIKLHKHHNIKDFDSSGIDQIIIDIENTHTLESVRITNCRNWFLRHKNMHFPHLKSLDLYRVYLPAYIFDNFSSFFPCLNELRLDSCRGPKEFRLLSSSIKRLTITGNRINAFIDTPNILYFEYSDDGNGVLPSIIFTTTSNEWKSRISVSYKLKPSDNDATSWLLKLNKLLKALSQSNITLIFIANKYKKLHTNDSYGGVYKLAVVEHLKLRKCFPSSSDPAILNCFFRICRPRYIHVDLYDYDTHKGMYFDLRATCKKVNNLAEFMSKPIPNEIGCYFWLKDLEEVGIEVWDEEAKEWYSVEGTSLPELSFRQQIRFRLKWTEQLSKLFRTLSC
ncbi:hypothetical protein CASFOL_022056 [Castilleja foliolosa]|uniref:F-box domain-containing protein n=1 Tax=Castilleja foliolosa TaxID=1961234 RepID=A0ABD3CZV7_9LAMI